MKIAKTVAFTGHRPSGLPFGENEFSPTCSKLHAMLLAEISDRISQGYDTFYCGAAMGSDIIFGRLVQMIRSVHHPEIRLVCVIPYEGQADNWSEAWRIRYSKLIEQADETILLSGQYTKDCYQARNRYMVDHAQALLAVYNGAETGGTAYTVTYARQRAKEIILINPSTMERSFIPPRLQAL